MPGAGVCFCRSAGLLDGHHLCQLCLCQEAKTRGEYVKDDDVVSDVDDAG